MFSHLLTPRKQAEDSPKPVFGSIHSESRLFSSILISEHHGHELHSLEGRKPTARQIGPELTEAPCWVLGYRQKM